MLFFTSASVCYKGVVGPLGINSLVEIHHHCILLGDLSVEDTFHMSVSSQGLLDVTPPSVFSFDFYRFEPVNVFSVEEHEPHCTDSLVDLEWVAREDGSLDDNPVGVIVEESPSSQQRQFAVTLFLQVNMMRSSPALTDCVVLPGRRVPELAGR